MTKRWVLWAPSPLGISKLARPYPHRILLPLPFAHISPLLFDLSISLSARFKTNKKTLLVWYLAFVREAKWSGCSCVYLNWEQINQLVCTPRNICQNRMYYMSYIHMKWRTPRHACSLYMSGRDAWNSKDTKLHSLLYQRRLSMINSFTSIQNTVNDYNMPLKMIQK